jgi:hypothetical protein
VVEELAAAHAGGQDDGVDVGAEAGEDTVLLLGRDLRGGHPPSPVLGRGVRGLEPGDDDSGVLLGNRLPVGLVGVEDFAEDLPAGDPELSVAHPAGWGVGTAAVSQGQEARSSSTGSRCSSAV